MRLPGFYWVMDRRGVSRVAEWNGRRWIKVMGWTDTYVDAGVIDSEFKQISETPLPPPEF